MPELTDSVFDKQNENNATEAQNNINLEELAEEVVRILIRELKIEDERTGRI